MNKSIGKEHSVQQNSISGSSSDVVNTVDGQVDNRVVELRDTLQRLPLQVTDEMCEQLLSFYAQLIKKNEVMNLTAITEYQEVVEKHFLDSLSLIYVCDPAGKRVLDLGTGAGFPGIPLKIVFPDTSMVLADSLQKRLRFLQEVIENCHLQEIETVHGRAEDLGKVNAPWRESFDVCVSRAVANLSSLSEYCLPFVKVGGCFVSYKSGDAQEETKQAEKAIRILGGKIEQTKTFQLPGTELGRTLILIRKIKATPKQYPRKAGLPGKQPL